MRRSLPAAVTTAAVALLLAGCTDADAPARADVPPSPGPAASRQPALAVPRAAEVLLPETSGTGSAQLPRFTPPGKAYTVYADCSGTGSVTLVDRSADGGRHPVHCDGATTVGVVHTPREPQHLAVQVTEGPATWRLTVVSGTQDQ
ncbi:hypothetical protein ACWDMR_17070 [Streptomyces althioticus]|uniref:hypothetical protein n=1 Tax=Streptomyces TaxID=1883 RepID=UPI0021C09C79|nr:hypothetical protein [Streptomyces lusitanus]